MRPRSSPLAYVLTALFLAAVPAFCGAATGSVRTTHLDALHCTRSQVAWESDSVAHLPSNISRENIFYECIGHTPTPDEMGAAIERDEASLAKLAVNNGAESVTDLYYGPARRRGQSVEAQGDDGDFGTALGDFLDRAFAN